MAPPPPAAAPIMTGTTSASVIGGTSVGVVEEGDRVGTNWDDGAVYAGGGAIRVGIDATASIEGKGVLFKDAGHEITLASVVTTDAEIGISKICEVI